MFSEEIPMGTLLSGWGVVTATDIPLAWVTARLVFGTGHPAVDYLLLLAVADDALGLVIIAVFYPDPDHPTEPIWLLLVAAGIFVAFLLRRWHFRIKRVKHQSWVPYVLLGGSLSWIGLSKAHLHAALALVPIVPFMPGPEARQLELFNDAVENEISGIVEQEMAQIAQDEAEAGICEITRAHSRNSVTTVLSQQHQYSRGRGHEIEAGLYAGIVGHRVEPTLHVTEYDTEGRLHTHASTLDDFEHTMKIYVDFGMFLFALCNAGVKIEGIGGMTWLVVLSLAIGKFSGIVIFGCIARRLGFPTPLGVRNRHLCMVGLIGGIGLTVALFIADAAFVDAKLTDDAKLGSLFSGLLAFIAVVIGRMANLNRSNDVVDTAIQQVKEAVAEADGEDCEGETDSDAN
mmetsp:Transcript_35007/g.96836  ORF Transcript_35007/g.96836 Transcript_35007/m.96836 type:complete len:402 (+) Transcript_35007:257-1462(+)